MIKFPFNYLFLNLLVSSVIAQQNYPGNLSLSCDDSDEARQSSAVLYSCNGKRHSCRAFLIFRSQHNYNTVSSISKLTWSDQLELARINNISDSAILPQDQEVIIPVNCSCSGQYYQANATYHIQSDNDTYFRIVTDTFQGLSTCIALMRENSYDAQHLFPGLSLRIPLRCACPTKNQIKNGIKFLLTYSISEYETTYTISQRFHTNITSISEANQFPEEDSIIYPSTTILIPLMVEPKGPLTSEARLVNLGPPSTLNRRDKTSNKELYIGIATGGFVAVLCFILVICFCHLRFVKRSEGVWKSKTGKRKMKLSASFLNSIAKIDQAVKIYTIEELEVATNRFDPQKKLGSSVYKGVLRGKLLAIKRTNTGVVEEIKILSKIYHFNVISLFGVCEHNGEFYLVYEFMENRSLKEWLQKEDNVETQSWNNRIVIALDVANGLDYIHNFTNPAYVHRYITSKNILLNKDLRAKIAYFSHARSADGAEESFLTPSSALAAKVYLAPEYLHTGKVTCKLDVYSFGVVLLELVSGREAAYVVDGKEVFLCDEILAVMDGSNTNVELLNFIDPRLQVQHPLGFVIDQTEVALRLVKLSLTCLAQDPDSRPSMAKIASDLVKIQRDVQRLEPFDLH